MSTNTFNADKDRWMAKLRADFAGISFNTASRLLTSIKDGSGDTSAPGQPYVSGFLHDSWQMDPQTPGASEYRIATNCAYAPCIEYKDRSRYDDRGTKPDVLNPINRTARPRVKSRMGGNHSVELTVLHWRKIIESVLKERGWGGKVAVT